MLQSAAGARPFHRRSGFPTYRPQWLQHDAIAGVTLAAYAIPVSLAYATLAGLPPQYGIYCYLVGGLFYALFGSSRQLAIGPTSAISMLVGVTIAGMAQGNPGRWADIAALTAFLVGCMCVLAWLLRLSSLVNFISETILLGFKAGAALTIAMTQLPKLFGVKGGGEFFFERIAILWQPDPRYQRRRADFRARRDSCDGARREISARPTGRAGRGDSFHRRVVGDAAGSARVQDCWRVAEGLARFPYAGGAGARCGRADSIGVRLYVAGLRGKRIGRTRAGGAEPL